MHPFILYSSTSHYFNPKAHNPTHLISVNPSISNKLPILTKSIIPTYFVAQPLVLHHSYLSIFHCFLVFSPFQLFAVEVQNTFFHHSNSCNPSSTIDPTNNPTPSTDRIISTLSYTLPFLNTLPYGRFLYAQFPPLLAAVSPFFPLLNLLHSVPFASFVAFFGLYLGVVRNPNLSKYVRFNAMQAVVLDVLLAIPSLLQRVVGVPNGGVGMKVLEVGYGGVFCFGIMCWVYGVVSCVMGKTPYLPIVATAANRQL